MDVFVSGVGMTRFGKSKGSLHQMMAEAALHALKDAGLERVDSICIGGMNGGEHGGSDDFAGLLAENLGLPAPLSGRVEFFPATGSAAFESAFYAVASGKVRNVLVLAGDKLSSPPSHRTARVQAEGVDRSERRYGATVPALMAMISRKYGQEAGLSASRIEEILAQVAVKNHFNGSLNAFASFGKALTLEEHRQSPWVSHPLRLLDCAPLADGAAALVLTSQRTSVRVSGIGRGADPSPIRNRAVFTSLLPTREAAVKAYTMARVNPADIRFAEVHDAYGLLEVIGTEDLGLFPVREGWKALEEGGTLLAGRLPINPSGGLMSRGFPAATSGLTQLVEIVWQVRGQAGEERQLERAEIGLALNLTGFGNPAYVTIVERADRKRSTAEAWKLAYTPETKPVRKPLSPPLPEGTGILETFTVLHAPPEGFRSPLTLAWVRVRSGEIVMACNLEYENPDELEMGGKVLLEIREGLHLFRKYDPLARVKGWFQKTFQPK